MKIWYLGTTGMPGAIPEEFASVEYHAPGAGEALGTGAGPNIEEID
jgi:hypothetical protein